MTRRPRANILSAQDISELGKVEAHEKGHGVDWNHEVAGRLVDQGLISIEGDRPNYRMTAAGWKAHAARPRPAMRNAMGFQEPPDPVFDALMVCAALPDRWEWFETNCAPQALLLKFARGLVEERARSIAANLRRVPLTMQPQLLQLARFRFVSDSSAVRIQIVHAYLAGAEANRLVETSK